MKFAVTTVSINRETRQQHAPPRTELVDTDRSEIFKDAVTALDIERTYEAFWNDPKNDLSDDRLADKFTLKVISVKAVRDWEASAYEKAAAGGLDPAELSLAVKHELTLLAAKRIAKEEDRARNPDTGGVTW